VCVDDTIGNSLENLVSICYGVNNQIYGIAKFNENATYHDDSSRFVIVRVFLDRKLLHIVAFIELAPLFSVLF